MIIGGNKQAGLERDKSRVLARFGRPITYIAALLLIPLIGLPMGFLIYGAFQSAPPGQQGTWTLENFDVLLTSDFLGLVRNSAILVVAATSIALVVGASLAVALTRFNVPAARFFDALVVIPAYIPAFVGAIAWSFLLAPQSGYLNQFFTSVGLPNFNIFSWGGIIGVTAIYSVPLVYLNLRPALLSIDRSLEESARMLGAGKLSVILKIVFPLVRPAVFSSTLIVLINSISEFAVVGVLGVSARIDVLALRIVELMVGGVYDPGRAAVLGVVLASVSVVGLGIIVRGLGNKDFSVIGARHSMEAPAKSRILMNLGLVLCIAYALVAVILPVAVLIIGSLQPYLSTTFSSGWTLNNYVLLASYPDAFKSVSNSVLLSVLAACACGLLAVVLAYIVVRRRGKLGKFVNYTATSPLAVPPAVFAVAMIWTWVGTSGLFYGTKWILLAAYIALLLPFAMRSAVTAFLQLDPVLEEAGRMSGASRARVALHIVTPLVLPGVLAGATIVLYNSMKAISASLILYAPGQPVIPVAIWGMVSNGQFAQLFALCVVYIALIFALVAVVSWIGRRYGRL